MPGAGLKVPVLREADAKSITEIASEMRDLVVTYLDDALAVGSLAGGTFTVTDLSGEGVTAFHPLINQGQSAILGICAEVFRPVPARGRSIWCWRSTISSRRAGPRPGSSASSATGSRPTSRRSSGEARKWSKSPLLAVPGGLPRTGGERPLPRPDSPRRRFDPAALQTLFPGVDVMSTAELLRKTVADFFEVNEGQVGPFFSLQGRAARVRSPGPRSIR